jgi:hypothetical protein
VTLDVPNQSARFAPGGPGIAARWTSSAKVGVGAAEQRQIERRIDAGAQMPVSR